MRALGGVGGALANQAQAVYDGLGEAERPIARRAFLAMVRLGEGTRDSRRRAPIAEIVTSGESEARVLAVLRRFAEPGRRLITLAGAGQAGDRRGRPRGAVRSLAPCCSNGSTAAAATSGSTGS